MSEGRGILGKAVGEVVDFCFFSAKINKLVVSMQEKNGRGRKVAERSGFVAEGVLKNCFIGESRIAVNLVQYGLVNPGIQ